ncbi:hypothetical protein PPERSA_11634 [Pseudocohnilembus persalinus]|uniref:Uncharacterized protein n=1 Tax=Pseudocohnilembus persalinus TaxID=266149 RepID=A0A0V0Q9Y0_PSEPJ|nr:hypothetical protein PPERSA_11634 [Pseudocohnilembus persalinus]|eukprot:KRW99033.1 hypothetical protein PPERSA_11634 [Pseudocohnilembus persalinus]
MDYQVQSFNKRFFQQNLLQFELLQNPLLDIYIQYYYYYWCQTPGRGGFFLFDQKFYLFQFLLLLQLLSQLLQSCSYQCQKLSSSSSQPTYFSFSYYFQYQ